MTVSYQFPESPVEQVFIGAVDDSARVVAAAAALQADAVELVGRVGVQVGQYRMLLAWPAPGPDAARVADLIRWLQAVDPTGRNLTTRWLVRGALGADQTTPAVVRLDLEFRTPAGDHNGLAVWWEARANQAALAILHADGLLGVLAEPAAHGPETRAALSARAWVPWELPVPDAALGAILRELVAAGR